jgi:hypothetical protein
MCQSCRSRVFYIRCQENIINLDDTKKNFMYNCGYKMLLIKK